MKQIYNILLILAILPLWSSCSDEAGSNENGTDILLENVQIQTVDKIAGTNASTRATIAGYVVNTDADPTSNDASDAARLSGQNSWNLDVKIYDRTNTQLYPPAIGTWSYGSTSWVPDPSPLYIPSYFKPRVEATLFYGASESPVVAQQGTAAELLQQDVLVQKTDPYTVTPAHILTIELIHKHSMLDFVLQDVNFDDINSVTVLANGIEYIPYKVDGVITTEYLVILPEGVSNPQVKVETNGGARYMKTLNIDSTVRNYCYCITFSGVTLVASSMFVVDWAYGIALAGQYTTPASYPTFRGLPLVTVTLVYNNGLSQEITFNERGESTVKPFGRTIIRVGDVDLSTTPIILDEMYVDLRNYLNQTP